MTASAAGLLGQLDGKSRLSKVLLISDTEIGTVPRPSPKTFSG